MAILDGFIGPSNRTRFRSVAGEDTINRYLERITDGTPKAPMVLVQRPGLSPFCGLGAGPVRALFFQNGRCFAVGGGNFCEVFPNQTVIVRGTMAVNALPATISSNGTAGLQLLITSGGLGYLFALDTNTFTQITDPVFPAGVTQGFFFDGYFIVLTIDGIFWLSTLYDGSTWNGLDFGQESQFSDTVIAMSKSHDNLWLYGTQNTGPWYNSGAADFPFQPIQGTLIEHGIIAPFSVVEIGNTPIWLGQDEHGIGFVWRANGYTPQSVGSIAMSDLLSTVSLGSLQQSVAWGYQDRGHLFYALQVPGLDSTLMYDLTVDAWHKADVWDPKLMGWTRHPGSCHAWAFGWHFVGDRQSGTIYIMDDRLTMDRLVA